MVVISKQYTVYGLLALVGIGLAIFVFSKGTSSSSSQTSSGTTPPGEKDVFIPPVLPMNCLNENEQEYIKKGQALVDKIPSQIKQSEDIKKEIIDKIQEIRRIFPSSNMSAYKQFLRNVDAIVNNKKDTEDVLDEENRVYINTRFALVAFAALNLLWSEENKLMNDVNKGQFEIQAIYDGANTSGCAQKALKQLEEMKNKINDAQKKILSTSNEIDKLLDSVIFIPKSGTKTSVENFEVPLTTTFSDFLTKYIKPLSTEVRDKLNVYVTKKTKISTKQSFIIIMILSSLFLFIISTVIAVVIHNAYTGAMRFLGIIPFMVSGGIITILFFVLERED